MPPSSAAPNTSSARVLRCVLRHVLRQALYVPVLYVSSKGKRGGRHACVGRWFRRWKMTMGKISAAATTTTFPSDAQGWS